MVKKYAWATVLGVLFLVAGTVVLGIFLVLLALGKPVSELLYINVSVSLYLIGHFLFVYRRSLLGLISQDIHDHGLPGVATILSAEFSGITEQEPDKKWYAVRLEVQPDDSAERKFNADIEQQFTENAPSLLRIGSTVPVRYCERAKMFTLIIDDEAYASLK